MREADICLCASPEFIELLEEDKDIVDYYEQDRKISISGWKELKMNWLNKSKFMMDQNDCENLFLSFQHIKIQIHLDWHIDRIDISNEYRGLYLERETAVGEKWFLSKKCIEQGKGTGENKTNITACVTRNYKIKLKHRFRQKSLNQK